MPARQPGTSGRAPPRPEQNAHHGLATRTRRHHQALPRRRGQRRREPARGAGPDPRRAGRERRRQIDADENHLRRGAARRRRHPPQRRRRADAQPAHGPRARRVHGVPAFLAVRHPQRGRERLARPRPRQHPGAGDAAHRRGGRRLRPRHRPRAAGAHAVGRRAPARGDHPRPADQPATADP
ncbi:hypothetical protein GALL_368890 [mine drainage metagenome]|uniref:Uncharacterized protein n=1 Tax=mine drainage metagenome TaxID=410659 RepID=A0A1J5QDT2_9ZZZZ